MGYASTGKAKAFAGAVEEKLMAFITSGTLYKGTWNASTNSPTITQGSGTNGWYYEVSTVGKWDNTDFLVGDKLIFSEKTSKWERIATGKEDDSTPMVVAYVTKATTAFPTTRASGKPLIEGDYVKVDSSAEEDLPFDIEGVHFDNLKDTAEWNGTAWQESSSSVGETNELKVSDKENESLSGESKTQDEINIEIVKEFNEKLIPEYEDLDDVEEEKRYNRIFKQTKDTTKRKKGLYWYDDSLTTDDKWVAVGSGSYEDITDDFKAIEYNKTNLTFGDDLKLLKIGDNIFCLSGTITPKTPITDMQSTERKIFELPSVCSAAEGKFYCDLYTQAGQHTCMENKTAFYDPSGSDYINPETYKTKKVTISGSANVGTYTSEGKEIPCAAQRLREGDYAELFNSDNSNIPEFERVIYQIDSTETAEVYKVYIPPFIGKSEYTLVKGDSGTQIGSKKYVNWYRQEKITVSPNADFLYNCALVDAGCDVDTDGYICDTEVEYTETAKLLDSKYDGTVTWTRKTFVEEERLEIVTVKNQVGYIRGEISVSKIILGGGSF